MRIRSKIAGIGWGAMGLWMAVSSGPLARAELTPAMVHVADLRKTQAYIRDGLIVGGDKAINEVVVRDIRRAANAKFERVVIDLEGTRAGEAAAIPRPPYYQVSVNPDEKRLVVTIFGKPRLAFDSRKVVSEFRRSRLVEGLELLPKLEDTSWTFSVDLKSGRPVEVFELSNPVRIIVDISRKDSGRAAD